MPSAIECGTAFGVKLGVKCVSECGAQAWQIDIRDHDGRVLAKVPVGEATWPGTALYAAEAELSAPVAEGLFAWEARVAALDADTSGGAAHEASAARFTVRAVPAPECLLTVIAVDAQTQAPIEGAKVVVHPYRGFTDARGIAKLNVPKGAYRLFVSGRDYLPFRADGEVKADLSITAHLAADVGPTDAEIWS